MKISNSKKQLAKIISENGGWLYGEFAVQNGNHGRISFSENKPTRYCATGWDACGGFAAKIECCKPLQNWHQTILSRAEYFHLYPAQDAVKPTDFGAIGDDETNLAAKEELETLEYKPTIEQLAADYRKLLDIAERKQKDADSAKAEADAKLGELDRAGKALGLIIGIVKDEPVKSDLNITDWRDLKVNDLIKITSVHERGNDKYYSVIGLEALVVRVGDPHHQDLEVIPANSGATLLIDGFEFIRRP